MALAAGRALRLAPSLFAVGALFALLAPLALFAVRLPDAHPFATPIAARTWIENATLAALACVLASAASLALLLRRDPAAGAQVGFGILAAASLVAIATAGSFVATAAESASDAARTSVGGFERGPPGSAAMVQEADAYGYAFDRVESAASGVVDLGELAFERGDVWMIRASLTPILDSRKTHVEQPTIRVEGLACGGGAMQLDDRGFERGASVFTWCRAESDGVARVAIDLAGSDPMAFRASVTSIPTRHAALVAPLDDRALQISLFLGLGTFLMMAASASRIPPASRGLVEASIALVAAAAALVWALALPARIAAPTANGGGTSLATHAAVAWAAFALAATSLALGARKRHAHASWARRAAIALLALAALAAPALLARAKPVGPAAPYGVLFLFATAVALAAVGWRARGGARLAS